MICHMIHASLHSLVGGPVMPEVDAPNTLWFLVIFVLFGLFLVAFGLLIVALISRECNRVYSFGKYSCKYKRIILVNRMISLFVF